MISAPLENSINKYLDRFNLPFVDFALRLVFSNRDKYVWLSEILDGRVSILEWKMFRKVHRKVSPKRLINSLALVVFLTAIYNIRKKTICYTLEIFNRLSLFDRFFSHPAIIREVVSDCEVFRKFKWTRKILHEWALDLEIVEIHKSEHVIHSLEKVYADSSGLIIDFLKNGLYLTNPSDDPRLPFVAGNWEVVTSLKDRRDATLRVSNFLSKNTTYMKRATDIRVRCSHNYWHALICGGSKLVRLLRSQEEVQSDIFLVSSDTPGTVLDAYETIAPEFKFKAIQRGELVFVEELVTCSDPAWVYDACVNSPERNFQFNQEILEEIAQKCIAHFGAEKSSSIYARKIFIERRGNWRNLHGSEALRSELTKQGFSMIYPELLDFESQVNIFRNAEIIVGASGAAWANLIFCRPETKVISICSELVAPWDMHKSIAAAMKLHYFQVISGKTKLRTGIPTLTYKNAIHDDFELTNKEIEQVLLHLQ